MMKHSPAFLERIWTKNKHREQFSDSAQQMVYTQLTTLIMQKLMDKWEIDKILV
jgi:hypothetical protein